MAMPADLVLVRHGRSEGNEAVERSKKGDSSCYTPEFSARHSSQWRLTDRGIEEAHSAGQWIQQSIGADFDAYITSEYVRAMETAALLGLPGAQWRTNFYLRERDWGDLDVIRHEERLTTYREHFDPRARDSFYWQPPNGESMATLCLRLFRVLDTLHRQYDGMRVVIVCHGGVMWGFRVILERMSQWHYNELDGSRAAHDRIHNCLVIHYTRIDPASARLSPRLGWYRSVCPWDMARSHNHWQTIDRVKYSNDELLAEAQRVPRMVNGHRPT